MQNKNLKEIDDLIFERLQYLFEIEDPLQFRDIFIFASKKKNCTLTESQLEDIWFEMVIEEFRDDKLANLMEERNTIGEYTSLITLIKTS